MFREMIQVTETSMTKHESDGQMKVKSFGPGKTALPHYEARPLNELTVSRAIQA